MKNESRLITLLEEFEQKLAAEGLYDDFKDLLAIATLSVQVNEMVESNEVRDILGTAFAEALYFITGEGEDE